MKRWCLLCGLCGLCLLISPLALLGCGKSEEEKPAANSAQAVPTTTKPHAKQGSLTDTAGP